MNFRWLRGNYIEPEWKLSREQVRTVHRLVKQRHMRSWVMFAMTGVWLVIIFSAVGLLSLPLASLMPGLPQTQAWLVSKTAIIVPLMVLSLWSYRIIYTRPVRRAMRDLGYDVCVNCGYWLRNLGEKVKQCPECGAQREEMPQGEE